MDSQEFLRQLLADFRVTDEIVVEDASNRECMPVRRVYSVDGQIRIVINELPSDEPQFTAENRQLRGIRIRVGEEDA